jgi:hypothetical protein
MRCYCKLFFKFFGKKFCIFEKYSYLCIRKKARHPNEVR